MAAMVVLARWIGGASGLLVLLLVPIVWVSPTTRLTLQIGNFQITAFALSILAMIAFDRDTRDGRLLTRILGGEQNYPGSWESRSSSNVAGAPSPGRRRGAYSSPPPRGSPSAARHSSISPATNCHASNRARRFSGSRMPPRPQSTTASTASSSSFGFSVCRGRDKRSQPCCEPLCRNPRAAGVRVRVAPQGTGRRHGRRAPAAPKSAGVAGTPQPGVVPEPVCSRCLRARRHTVAADARGGGRPLAARGRATLAVAAALSMIVLDGGPISVPVPVWIMAATLALQVAAITFTSRSCSRPAGRRLPAACSAPAQPPAPVPAPAL